MAKNRVIGVNNTLPWHLSADLKRFKALTMGHHIIMGRKTFESIGRVLPGRTSIVITRDESHRPAGVITARGMSEALACCMGDDEVFVIGGERIFREALPLANRIHATELAREYDGDTYFPAIEPTQWRETSAEQFTEGEIRGRFVTYDRSIPG